MKKKAIKKTVVFARISLSGTNETVWLVAPGHHDVLAYIESKYRNGSYYGLRFCSVAEVTRETGEEARIERLTSIQIPVRAFQWHVQYSSDDPNLIQQS